MLKKIFLPVFILTFFIIITSCATTSLGIKEHTQRYADKTVLLSGEITTLVNIPFTDVSVYLFEDSKGKVIVLSGAGHSNGDKFILKGTVAAFPEKSTIESSDKFIKIAEDFFIQNDILSKNKAKKAAVVTSKVLTKLMNTLGNAFIITEKM